MKAREENAQELDHVGGPDDEAAAGGEALGEGPHPQVDLVLEPEQLRGAGPAGAEHAGSVRLVDHQPRPVGAAEIDDRGQVADVALHREDAVDDDQDAAAVLGRASQHLLQFVHLVVAKGAQFGAGDADAVEDRGVVAGVADHRVGRAEDRPDRADVGLVAGGVDDRVVGAHPFRQLALEIEVERRGAVEQARAGHPGAVGLERLAGRLLDPRIAGQSQVVVGAEHDRLAPLHLDHRAGLRGEQAEVGEEVVLFGGFELLEPVVLARLGEDVDRGLDGLAHRPESR